jgi:hypothetical protein
MRLTEEYRQGGWQSTCLSDQFLDRVRRSYKLSTRVEALAHDSIWLGIGALQAPIHAALMAPDNGGLREIFANPVSSDLYYGVDNLAHTLMVGRDLPELEKGGAANSRDQLIHLAEAMGLLRWLPPGAEHTLSGCDPSSDIEDVLLKLSERIGFDIKFPNPFSGELGIRTSRGLASYRAIHALYQTYRISQELNAKTNRSVLEIGPGMGRTAYYASQAGLRDYTTIDLPLGVAAQACFLSATLGPDAIWMIGDNPADADTKIRLLPNTFPLPEKDFGLVLNVDSMTEMDAASIPVYAGWIASHAETFLSINHEANTSTIADLGRRFFSSAATTRAPYWMRIGYVEETFRFAPYQFAKEFDELRAVVSKMRASTSWRITAPLRLMRNRLRF